MSILIFLRQYSLREYAITLSVAAIVGLGLAVLINAAGGGSAGAPAALKTKEQLTASTRVLPARVDKPLVPKARPVVKHRRRVRRHTAPKVNPAPRPAPAQKLVATRTPAPQPVSTPAPKPKPAPVVNKPAPAPAPKPKPAPTRKTGGGGGQFDDSG